MIITHEELALPERSGMSMMARIGGLLPTPAHPTTRQSMVQVAVGQTDHRLPAFLCRPKHRMADIH